MDIQSFMKSTPARVLKDNLSYFSNEAQVELTEKRSKVKDKFSSCCCTGADDSAWYSQLGTASSLEELRSTFVNRCVGGHSSNYSDSAGNSSPDSVINNVLPLNGLS